MSTDTNELLTLTCAAEGCEQAETFANWDDYRARGHRIGWGFDGVRASCPEHTRQLVRAAKADRDADEQAWVEPLRWTMTSRHLDRFPRTAAVITLDESKADAAAVAVWADVNPGHAHRLVVTLMDLVDQVLAPSGRHVHWGKAAELVQLQDREGFSGLPHARDALAAVVVEAGTVVGGRLYVEDAPF